MTASPSRSSLGRLRDSEAPHGERSAAQRILLVISAQPSPDLPRAIAEGREPRRDYFALQRALDADLLFRDEGNRSGIGRALGRIGGARLALAWEAFRRSHAYDVVYSDGENVGLPFALMLKLRTLLQGSKKQPRHVMLAHYLSTWQKRLLFRLGAGSHVSKLIVHSSAQEAMAKDALGMPAERVVRLPYFTDERFWRADAGDEAEAVRVVGAGEQHPMICAVGLEFRDYSTLVEAVRAMPVDLRIAAASTWSHHSAFAGSPELPPHVTVHSYSYLPLRALYAAARFVVVPLHEVDNQAGITVILEAMAMGKAVIVSATRGQTDVVRDRRNGGRGRVEREWWPGFVDAPEVAKRLGHLVTGFYVRPGDAAELGRAIAYLLAHPDLAEEMGRNGRRAVEEIFGLDAFAARFATVIRGRPIPVGFASAAVP
ncbi:MAG: glycosyltransferase family 4 protein [Ktedonobacterales bacterium]